MPEIMANTNNGKYPIHVRTGSLAKLGDIAAATVKGRKVFVVTDTNVAPLYLGKAIASLKDAGFATYSCTVTAGETAKCKDMLFLLSQMEVITPSSSGKPHTDIIMERFLI